MTDGVSVADDVDLAGAADTAIDALQVPFQAANGAIEGMLNSMGINDPMMLRIAQAAAIFLGGDFILDKATNIPGLDKIPGFGEDGFMDKAGGLILGAMALSTVMTGDPFAVIKGGIDGFTQRGGAEIAQLTGGDVVPGGPGVAIPAT